MAGYIFAVSKELMNSVMNNNIKYGYFTPYTPLVSEELLEPDKERSRKSINKVLLSIFSDLISMREGDNIYFLSNRKIYGVGVLKNIGVDCKYDNYIGSSKILPNCDYRDIEYLTTNDSRARWVCFFEPGNHFMTRGVDMDDVLRYNMSAFKMLRAFEGVSFIKVDDEENKALKEYLYLFNDALLSDGSGCLEFDSELHKKLEKIELRDYIMDINSSLKDENNRKYLFSEMLIEASLLQNLTYNYNSIFGDWDYLSHQLIASPFKPLQYIDKIDVFGYKYSCFYPEKKSLVSKFLLVELKKDKINRASLEQTMQYVDWICKEYASGDYSRIEAYVIGNGVTRNIKEVIEKNCQRNYIVKSHPVVTESWNNIHLVKYLINDKVEFEEISFL